MIIRELITKVMRGRANLCLAVLIAVAAACFWTSARPAQAWTPIPILSSNANLSDLWISTGSLSPAFAPGTTSYTSNANNPLATVKPFVEESHATITVNGTPVTSGDWSPAIPINPGPNTVTVLVTAQNGITTKTYTVTVTGPAASSDANLSDLITNSGQLEPAFAPGTTSYTQTYTGPNVLLKPTAAESHATIMVNSTAVASGQWSQAITLNPGQNTITVVVTAQDGITTKTYTITVTMPATPASSNANLSNLELSTGGISPAFAPGTASYSQDVGNATASVKVKPTVEESHATITVNGTPVTSGQWSGNIPLNVGDNTVSVVVTAQDGITTKTYTITVNKAATTLLSAPVAPTGLTSVASGTSVALSWTDNATNEDSFRIERKIAGGSYSQVATVGANVTSATDANLSPGATYYYRAYAYNTSGNSGYSNESSITLAGNTSTQTVSQTLLRYYIGGSDCYVNDQVKSMDTVPIIKDDRTLLPIRYVAEPLGASVDWNSADQKVTVTMNGKKIELWIDQNTARVNGVDIPIDPNNQNVVPIVVPPGRTMLPLRFIAENLGCQVDWNQSLQMVTVTYPKP